MSLEITIPVLIKRKIIQIKNLGSIRELRSQDKLLTPKLKRYTVGYRETLVIRVEAQKQETLQQPLPVFFYLPLTSGFQQDRSYMFLSLV